MKSAAIALGTALIAGPALAQDPAYLDDRSSAASLIRSYYNAVSRREYGRAWDYFGETKPAADFDTFSKGYAGVATVSVVTGNVATEGAAGSTIHYFPVAVVSVGADGSEQVFAGCYVARLANPQIQETPFQPLHLERGSLKLAQQPVEDAVPEKCEDGPEPEAADALLDAAKAAFAAGHAGQCTPPGGNAAPAEPESYAISYRHQTDADEGPERQARLFRFFCSMGAYNENHVYYLHNEIDGLEELQFAMPELDIRYENDDSEGPVESIGIVGYFAEGRLVNSFYDEATKSLTSHAKWRGVGDASSLGYWIFRDGQFTLVRYEVDATYDGEINPETVLDYDTAP